MNRHRSTKHSAAGFRASLRDDGTLEILAYGDIIDAATMSMLESYGYDTSGFITAGAIKKQMDAGRYSRIALRINSPGGDAFEGAAIYSLLRASGKPIDAYVDGIAASSASIIAMAGDTITMGRAAMMMIHNAWCACVGNADDMRKMADTLDKVNESIAETYTHRTGKSARAVKALMDAETWMSAKDCLAEGFATSIAEEPDEQGASAMAMARKFKALGRFKKLPSTLNRSADTEDTCECDCAPCSKGNCSDCNMNGCDDPNCEDCPMQGDDGAAENNLNAYEARLAILGIRRN